MKLLREYIREILDEKTKKSFSENKYESNIHLEEGKIETVGDLKKLIAHAIKKKKITQGKKGLKDAAKDSVFDEILGKLPLGMTIKNTLGVVKAAYKLPDKARTGTALDYLDVDDEVSAIVDDPIENKFLAHIVSQLEKSDDKKRLEDLDMTKKLSQFLGNQFNSRTIVGYEKK